MPIQEYYNLCTIYMSTILLFIKLKILSNITNILFSFIYLIEESTKEEWPDEDKEFLQNFIISKAMKEAPEVLLDMDDKQRNSTARLLSELKKFPSKAQKGGRRRPSSKSIIYTMMSQEVKTIASIHCYL